MNKYGLEARANWIAARIDELMDDADFVGRWEFQGGLTFQDYARQQAEREHRKIMADLEDERINAAREY